MISNFESNLIRNNRPTFLHRMRHAAVSDSPSISCLTWHTHNSWNSSNRDGVPDAYLGCHPAWLIRHQGRLVRADLPFPITEVKPQCIPIDGQDHSKDHKDAI